MKSSNNKVQFVFSIIRIVFFFRRAWVALLILIAVISTGKSLNAQSGDGWHSRTDFRELAKTVGQVYEIESELIIAISRLESANFTSTLTKTHKNYFGIKDCRDCEGYEKFISAEECFFHFGAMLRRVYDNCLDQKIEFVVLCISKKYADDMGWYSKVLELYNEEKQKI